LQFNQWILRACAALCLFFRGGNGIHEIFSLGDDAMGADALGVETMGVETME
jgi:hypothetical protein